MFFGKEFIPFFCFLLHGRPLSTNAGDELFYAHNDSVVLMVSAPVNISLANLFLTMIVVYLIAHSYLAFISHFTLYLEYKFSFKHKRKQGLEKYYSG